jgi:F-type H+-transporting ATPase subunit delta
MDQNMKFARPYAKAVISIARFSGLYAEWANVLANINLIVSNTAVNAFIKNKTISFEKKAETVIDLGGGFFLERGQNLIKLLAQQKRLLIIPQIEELFAKMRDEAEQKQEVIIVSAVSLKKPQMEKIVNKLCKELACAVIPSFEVDESVLGGVLIKAGNRVIDATIRGQLQELYTSLKH